MTAHGFPCNRVRRNPRRAARRVRREPRRAGGSRGFTLVEILVAIVLVSFGVLGFAGLLEVIGSTEAEQTWRAKALFCAQERMEELAFAFVSGEAVTAEGREDLEYGPYRGMRREWNVSDSGLFEGLLQVDVACAYPWKGARKSVGLSTLVFPQGDGTE